MELEVPISFIKNASLLQSYVPRGFLYSFVGLIGMEESYAVFVQGLKAEHGRSPEYDEVHISWETLLIKGSSLAMVVLGCAYMILGAFCMQGVRENLRKNHREAMERYRVAKLRHEQKKENAGLYSFGK